MKKISPLLLTVLILTGCNTVSENDWVQTPGNDAMEGRIESLVKPEDNSGEQASSDDKNSSEMQTQVEQVKTEFWPEPPHFKMEKFKVTKIIEGNLIEVDGQEKVRLLGISTETSEEYKRVYLEVPEELAIKYLSNTILNKTVYLEQNPKFPRNPDGETVAYVWMGNSEKLSNVNALMLENGVAIAERIDNVTTAYDEIFKKLENQANNEQLGIWNPNE